MHVARIGLLFFGMSGILLNWSLISMETLIFLKLPVKY